MSDFNSYYELINDPDAYWIIHDLCLEHNTACPEFVIPPWMYLCSRQFVLIPDHSCSYHNSLSLVGEMAVSRSGKVIDCDGVFGSKLYTFRSDDYYGD